MLVSRDTYSGVLCSSIVCNESHNPIKTNKLCAIILINNHKHFYVDFITYEMVRH